MKISQLPSNSALASTDYMVKETGTGVTQKIAATDLVANNLTTVDAGKVLDARQGKALSDAVANVTKLINPSVSTLSDFLGALDTALSWQGAIYVYVGAAVASSLGLVSSCTGVLIANSANYRTLTLYSTDGTKIYGITKHNGTWGSAFKSVALT